MGTSALHLRDERANAMFLSGCCREGKQAFLELGFVVRPESTSVTMKRKIDTNQ
jgi:hypothetical protein